MEKNNDLRPNISVEDLFVFISIGLVTIIWFSITFLEIKIFNIYSILAILLAGIIISFYCINIFIRDNLRLEFPKLDTIAIIITLVFCLFNSIYFHEPFSGGRDDGVYANGATYIAKHDTFYIDNEIAKTFPGFIQTNDEIRMQFYLGYSTWIAMFIKIFGLNSYPFVNFPLLFVGILSIYFISKRIIGEKFSIIALILILTSFPFFWFTRKVFSENLALMLTWFGSLCVLLAYEKRKRMYLLPALVCFSTMLMVRIDSVSLILGLILFIIIQVFRKQIKLPNKYSLLLVFAIISSSIFYYTFLDTEYLSRLINYGSNFLVNIFTNGVASTTSTHQLQTSTAGKKVIENQLPQFVYLLLQLYNLYFFVLFIPIAIIKAFFIKTKNSNYYFLLMLLLIPNLYFLLNPSINLDQPWFLRRFTPVVVPLSIVSFCYVIQNLTIKQLQIILSIIILFNMWIAAPIVFFKEYYGVMDTLRTQISSSFSNNDLLLVDYSNLGHYKIPEPLFFQFDINAAAIQPQSLAKLFGENQSKEKSLYSDQYFNVKPKTVCKFQHVFLVTNDHQNLFTDYFKEGQLSSYKDFTLSYSELIRTCELFRITDHPSIDEMANVDIYSAKAYCKAVPSQIADYSINIRIYKINDSIVNNLKLSNCH